MDTAFPDGAPRLNHEARLIVKVNARAIRAKDMSANVSLPEGFELVSGNLSWVGDVAEGSEVEVIIAVIRAIKEGNWTIRTVSYIDPKEHGFLAGPANYPIYVRVSKDLAEWGVTPPWYKKDGVVEPVPTPVAPLPVRPKQ